MTISKERIALGVILCAALGVMANGYPGKSASALEGQTGLQDVRNLDRRVSSLEQRLYSIEMSLSRLERSAISQRPPVSSPGVSDPEVNLLRGGIQALDLRLIEIECGLIKLDERTASAAAREARKNAGGNADPCRINPGGPLRLSTRP